MYVLLVFVFHRLRPKQLIYLISPHLYEVQVTRVGLTVCVLALQETNPVHPCTHWSERAALQLLLDLVGAAA